mgnify:CR=1 FL=1
MTKAVQAGVPKLRIEESAAIRQARIEKKEEVISIELDKNLIENTREKLPFLKDRRM